MMWMGDDEGSLKFVIGVMIWGAASCNLSADILPHVPKKPITPLSKAFLQLDMPFIQASFSPGKSLFII